MTRLFSELFFLFLTLSVQADSPKIVRPETALPTSETRCPLDRVILEQAIENARAFLLHNQRPAGNFHYQYNFLTRQDTKGDNAARQAGALWGLVLLQRDRPTPETFNAIRNGLRFFAAHSRDFSKKRQAPVYPNTRLGSTNCLAVIILSIADFLPETTKLRASERKGYAEYLAGCLRMLLSLRNRQGLFAAAFDPKTGEPAATPSPYSDGEALLALARVAKQAKHSNLLPLLRDSADAMYQQHVLAARKINPDSSETKGFFQWGILAFRDIAETDRESRTQFTDAGIELAHWMIDTHQILQRSRNTGYAFEGLLAALELARKKQDPASAKEFEAVIREGLGKLLTWQVGGPCPNSFLQNHPANDPRAVGGILNGARDPLLRIDVTQHQLHAMLMACRQLKK